MYDAWNRLVKVTLDDTDVTIQTASYDPHIVQCSLHYMRIDAVLGLKLADLGRVYLHQDANYNVIANPPVGLVSVRFVWSPRREWGGRGALCVVAERPGRLNRTHDVGATDLTGRVLEATATAPTASRRSWWTPTSSTTTTATWTIRT